MGGRDMSHDTLVPRVDGSEAASRDIPQTLPGFLRPIRDGRLRAGTNAERRPGTRDHGGPDDELVVCQRAQRLVQG